MGLQPNIARRRSFSLKQCNKCGGTFAPDAFAPTKSIFYADGALPICNSCIEDWLGAEDYDWALVNNCANGLIFHSCPKSGTAYLK